MSHYFGYESFSISPMDVKFTQDSIAYYFRRYDQVNPTGEKIARGELPINFFLPIAVIYRNNGYFSLDNRRLYIFRILNLLDILDTILVKETQYYDPRKLTTTNEGCHLYVRGRRSKTFRHCCCNTGRMQNLPTWWIENLNLASLKKKLVYPKPNIPMYSHDYSPIHVDQNHKNIHSRFDEENWQNNRVRSIYNEDNNSYSNSVEVRNLSSAVAETNVASTEDKKSSNSQFTTVITVQPQHPFLDEVSCHFSRSPTPERPTSSEDIPSLPMPSPRGASSNERRRLPPSLPCINNNRLITFDKDFPNFYRVSASFEKSQSSLESAIHQTNVPDEQLKAGTAEKDFLEENKCDDESSSKLKELQLEENEDSGSVSSLPQIECTPDFDQDVQPVVTVRPPSAMLAQSENRNEREQEDKVSTGQDLSKSDMLPKVAVTPPSTKLTQNKRKQDDKLPTDQECCSTPCCAQLYELVMSWLKLCQS